MWSRAEPSRSAGWLTARRPTLSHPPGLLARLMAGLAWLGTSEALGGGALGFSRKVHRWPSGKHLSSRTKGVAATARGGGGAVRRPAQCTRVRTSLVSERKGGGGRPVMPANGRERRLLQAAGALPGVVLAHALPSRLPCTAMVIQKEKAPTTDELSTQSVLISLSRMIGCAEPKSKQAR